MKTYCGVLLDDNNRQPIFRLWFSTSQRYVSLCEAENRSEERVPIDKAADINSLADRLRATLRHYEE